jgi:DNA-binding MarR family transcriptional regulator
MENYEEIKKSLTDLEKEVLYLYYISETSLYNETIANVLKKDQKDIDAIIEKLVEKGLIKWIRLI